MSIFEKNPRFFQNIQVASHSDKKIKRIRLYRCPCPPDGSCFFHAVLLATSVTYRNACAYQRNQICATFRSQLADYLHSEIQVRYEDGRIDWISVYSYLSRGELGNTSRVLPQYSLQNLDAWIRSTRAVGLEVMELVSIFLNINIYILNTQNVAEGENVYNPGDVDFLYPAQRNSIVLYFNGDHYDLCVTDHPSFPGEFATFFLSNNPLISSIREKLGLSSGYE
jgi:hypothetical protein